MALRRCWYCDSGATDTEEPTGRPVCAGCAVNRERCLALREFDSAVAREEVEARADLLARLSDVTLTDDELAEYEREWDG